MSIEEKRVAKMKICVHPSVRRIQPASGVRDVAGQRAAPPEEAREKRFASRMHAKELSKQPS